MKWKGLLSKFLFGVSAFRILKIIISRASYLSRKLSEAYIVLKWSCPESSVVLLFVPSSFSILVFPFSISFSHLSPSLLFVELASILGVSSHYLLVFWQRLSMLDDVQHWPFHPLLRVDEVSDHFDVHCYWRFLNMLSLLFNLLITFVLFWFLSLCCWVSSFCCLLVCCQI